jgi:hypothetical protein
MFTTKSTFFMILSGFLDQKVVLKRVGPKQIFGTSKHNHQTKEKVMVGRIRKDGKPRESKIDNFVQEHSHTILLAMVLANGTLVMYCLGRWVKADRQLIQMLGVVEKLEGAKSLADARRIFTRSQYLRLFDEVARGDSFVYDAVKDQLVNVTKNAAKGITK